MSAVPGGRSGPGSTGGPPAPDWDVGEYERTAASLLPAAAAVVAAARLAPGERVVDVGCGPGSVALIAARSGAEVVGVDPAPRLLRVADEAARSEGLAVRFVRGVAEALPVPDRSQDAVLSNFGVIFAADPRSAIAEMARVLAPTGRAVFSDWIRGGLIDDVLRTSMEALGEALGAPPAADQGPRFSWHDPAALTEAFERHGMSTTTTEHELVVTASSPEAYLREEFNTHPFAVAAVHALEGLGQADATQARLLALLRVGNEDPSGFRTTRRYAITTATRVAAGQRSRGAADWARRGGESFLRPSP